MFHIFHCSPDFFSYLPTKVRKINEFSKIFQGNFLAHPYRQMNTFKYFSAYPLAYCMQAQPLQARPALYTDCGQCYRSYGASVKRYPQIRIFTRKSLDDWKIMLIFAALNIKKVMINI